MIQSYELETLQPTGAQRAKIVIYTRMQLDTILHYIDVYTVCLGRRPAGILVSRQMNLNSGCQH